MDDDDLGTPNCTRCLVRMTPETLNGVVAWVCPDCGLVRL